MTNPTQLFTPSASRLHRRLLAVGLVAGASAIGTAGIASAQVPTVDAGQRTPVAAATAPVSPAALPVSWVGDATQQRRTTFVTVTL